jgi:hypothetical protein
MVKSFDKLSEDQFVKADLLLCVLAQAELKFLFCCETAVIHTELISLSKYWLASQEGLCSME